LGLDPNHVRFEIEPLIAQALGDFDDFKMLRDELGNRRSVIDNIPDQGSMVFPDGTSIVEG
jgi:hypothetical protein